MKIIHSTFLFTLVIILVSGCKFLFPDDVEIESKNPREYDWSVDTLVYLDNEDIVLNSLWGTNSRDITAVGSTPGVLGAMWHFNGDSWTDVKLNTSQGGIIRGAYKFLDNWDASYLDKYAVGIKYTHNGDSSFVIKYDGQQWGQIDGLGIGYLESVGGNSTDNVWAGGANNLLHFDGNNWSRNEQIRNLSPTLNQYMVILDISKTIDQPVYASVIGTSPYAYIINFSNGNWSLIDSVENGLYYDLWISDDGSLHVVTQHSVRKYYGTSFTEILSADFGGFYGITGTNDDNIFLLCFSYQGNHHSPIILHYNGIDWFKYDLPLSESAAPRDIQLIDGELFTIVSSYSEPHKTYVLHGR